MKYNLLLRFTILIAIITTFLASCNKSQRPGTDDGDEETEVPSKPPTPVTSALGVYVYNNDQVSNPLQFLTRDNSGWNNVPYQVNFDQFSSGLRTLDMYHTQMECWITTTFNNPGFFLYKTFTASSEIKNYAGFKFPSYTDAGVVRNLGGETTLTLPGNGSLQFPSEALSSIGLDMNYEFLVDYSNPSQNEFAVSLPNLSMGDDKAKRYFLESYGVYYLRPILTYCNCNIISGSDLFAKDVILRMPIPADRLASAPDSIDTWHLNGELLTWEKRGKAVKKDGFYEAGIRQHGAWNFAIPRNGAYVTLQLSSSNGIAIPNTRFVVKNSNQEIAEGRTDMEGNALVLVPVNQPLAFNIINDHFFNYLHLQIPDINLGSFSKGSEKKIVLPARNDIGTLEATVYNCDGSSFGNGAVRISQDGAKDDYLVPIVNAKFQTANWIRNDFSPTRLTFFNASGDSIFQVNTCLGSEYINHQKILQENFYGCPEANSLYCNYQIDGGATIAIVGNTNQAAPVLLAQPQPGYTIINIQDGSKNISFSMWHGGGNWGVIGTVPGFSLNNTVYSYGATRELTIYRNDNVSNGIMEGWFAIDYLDATNKSHTLTGNFRIKIE